MQLLELRTVSKRERTKYGMQATSEIGFAYCLSDCYDAKLSGYTVDGTFSEYVVSYVSCVTPIPNGLPSEDAASILCAVRLKLDASIAAR